MGLTASLAQCLETGGCENKLVEEHSSQGKGLEKRGESLDLEAVLRIITPATACNYSGFIESNLSVS